MPAEAGDWELCAGKCRSMHAKYSNIPWTISSDAREGSLGPQNLLAYTSFGGGERWPPWDGVNTR